MLETVIDQRRRSLGGFDVGRVLPHAQHRMVGPFVFLDHMGPVEFPRGISRDVDVRPHPHIGLATVTYLFDGEIMHRDSIGSEQPIRPAEVNWMTAGKGITHSERFEKARAEGGVMHGVQAWVGLPREDEEIEPGFAHYAGKDLPALEDGGISLRLVAGQAFGLKAAVPTRSPLFYADAVLAAGARLALPDDHDERAVFVISGTVEADSRTFRDGQLLVFQPKVPAFVTTKSDARLIALGGAPIGPRFIEWNFVSSSKDRIEQAKADWRAQRMKLPVHDDREFTPLPPDPQGTSKASPL